MVPAKSCTVPVSVTVKRVALLGTSIRRCTVAVAPTAKFGKEITGFTEAGSRVGVPVPVTVRRVSVMTLTLSAIPVPMLVTRTSTNITPVDCVPCPTTDHESFGAPTVPVPVSDTVWVPALSMIVTAPVRVPVAVGEKVTDTVQKFDAVRLAAQSFESAKSPDARILVKLSVALPELVIVKVCATLVVPMFWLAKVNAVFDSVTFGAAAAVPVPVAEKFCVPALSVTVNVTF